MRVVLICLLVALAALLLNLSGAWDYLTLGCQRFLTLYDDDSSDSIPPSSSSPSTSFPSSSLSLADQDKDDEAAAAEAITMWCTEEPLCSSPRLTLYGYLHCRLTRHPLALDSAAYRAYVLYRLHTLGTRRIKGWSWGHRRVHELIRRTLHDASAPRLVLHLAGDNGVGKTRMAEVISLALAQRCGNAGCTVGDSTLELSGSSFDGLSVHEFRAVVLPLVVQHVKRFPRYGVIILNDLSALEPSKVRVLLPLLGRGSFFPEHPDVLLDGQVVLITTDFGREGQTQGMSLAEMARFIKWEFQKLYGVEADSMVHTLPFLPISLATASAIARMTVYDMVCSLCKAYSSRAWKYGRCKERREPALVQTSSMHPTQQPHSGSSSKDFLACSSGRGTCAVSNVTDTAGWSAARRPCPMHLSDDAVAWLLESVKPLLSVENGRAVVQEVGLVVEPLLADYEQRHRDKYAHDAARIHQNSICEAHCNIDVNDMGQLYVQCG